MATTKTDRRVNHRKREAAKEVAAKLTPFLKNQITALAIHDEHRIIVEDAFYPEHSARTESPGYKKVHDAMVKNDNLPCLVCGVTFKILKTDKGKQTKQNPYGAKQLETHHHVIEWALANAIDPAKFNARVRAGLAKRPNHDPMYDHDMTKQEVVDWVDHHRDNLWVLCDVHHRGKHYGIHALTGPIWGPQDLFDETFLDAVRREVAKLATAPKAKGTSTSKKARKRTTTQASR